MGFVFFIPDLIAFVITCAIAFLVILLPSIVFAWYYREGKSELLKRIIDFTHLVLPTTVYIIGSIKLLTGGFRTLF